MYVNSLSLLKVQKKNDKEYLSAFTARGTYDTRQTLDVKLEISSFQMKHISRNPLHMSSPKESETGVVGYL